MPFQGTRHCSRPLCKARGVSRGYPFVIIYRKESRPDTLRQEFSPSIKRLFLEPLSGVFFPSSLLVEKKRGEFFRGLEQTDSTRRRVDTGSPAISLHARLDRRQEELRQRRFLWRKRWKRCQ